MFNTTFIKEEIDAHMQDKTASSCDIYDPAMHSNIGHFRQQQIPFGWTGCQQTCSSATALFSKAQVTQRKQEMIPVHQSAQIEAQNEGGGKQEQQQQQPKPNEHVVKVKEEKDLDGSFSVTSEAVAVTDFMQRAIPKHYLKTERLDQFKAINLESIINCNSMNALMNHEEEEDSENKVSRYGSYVKAVPAAVINSEQMADESWMQNIQLMHSSNTPQNEIEHSITPTTNNSNAMQQMSYYDANSSNHNSFNLGTPMNNTGPGQEQQQQQNLQQLIEGSVKQGEETSLQDGVDCSFDNVPTGKNMTPTTSTSTSLPVVCSYVCPVPGCGASFAKPYHLKRHTKYHTGEKLYDCIWPDCGRSFRRSDELLRHRRSHTGEKRHVCTVCSKRFSRADHLSIHQRVHSRSKVVVQKIDPQQAQQLLMMVKDERGTNHQGEVGSTSSSGKDGSSGTVNLKTTKPRSNLVCPVPNCSVAFKKLFRLSEHLRIHTGEKPHVCLWPGCSMRFTRSGELVRHRRSHTGEKAYICLVCQRGFSRSDYLKAHQRVHRSL